MIYDSLQDKARSSPSTRARSSHRDLPARAAHDPAGTVMDPATRRIFVACPASHSSCSTPTREKFLRRFRSARATTPRIRSRAQLAFASNGDGTLAVVHETVRKNFSRRNRRHGIRPPHVAVDPKTHRLFLPSPISPPRGGRPKKIRSAGARWCGVVRILVFEP